MYDGKNFIELHGKYTVSSCDKEQVEVLGEKLELILNKGKIFFKSILFFSR